MKVKLKKLHEKAVIPSYALEGDAGLDLTAVRMEFDAFDNVVYYTGIAIEIPKGYVGLIYPRSSVYNKDLILSNSVGVIDSGYRGEISVKFKIIDDFPQVYETGNRIAQLIIIPYPSIEFEEVEELSESERGLDGYGSTNKKQS